MDELFLTHGKYLIFLNTRDFMHESHIQLKLSECLPVF